MTIRSEDALHQHAIGGKPLVQLSVDDDVICVVPDDFLALDLVHRDALLQDVGDEVEAPIISGLRH
jgi:hypothetical protein